MHDKYENSRKRCILVILVSIVSMVRTVYPMDTREKKEPVIEQSSWLSSVRDWRDWLEETVFWPLAYNHNTGDIERSAQEQIDGALTDYRLKTAWLKPTTPGMHRGNELVARIEEIRDKKQYKTYDQRTHLWQEIQRLYAVLDTLEPFIVKAGSPTPPPPKKKKRKKRKLPEGPAVPDVPHEPVIVDAAWWATVYDMVQDRRYQRYMIGASGLGGLVFVYVVRRYASLTTVRKRNLKALKVLIVAAGGMVEGNGSYREAYDGCAADLDMLSVQMKQRLLTFCIEGQGGRLAAYIRDSCMPAVELRIDQLREKSLFKRILMGFRYNLAYRRR